MLFGEDGLGNTCQCCIGALSGSIVQVMLVIVTAALLVVHFWLNNSRIFSELFTSIMQANFREFFW